MLAFVSAAHGVSSSYLENISVPLHHCEAYRWIFWGASARVGIMSYTTQQSSPIKGVNMKVSEILQVKGDILYTVSPDTAWPMP
jgi:hypothetical protein